MGTLADLKQRIIDEMVRSDLAGDRAASLSRAIDQSIDYYANLQFWFNQGIGYATTTPLNEYCDQPAGFRSYSRVAITVGATQYPLKPKSLVEIEDISKAIISRGQPYMYAVQSDQVRLYPIPNQAFQLTFVGIVDLPALSLDTSSNAWTTEAQDLIAARARKVLYRDTFRDPEGATIAAAAEAEALAYLRGQTAKRLGSGRITPS